MSMEIRDLTGSPSLLGLYGKAALPALPGLSRVPMLRSLAAGRRGRDTLPELELRRPGVRIDANHLSAYQGVCGFQLSRQVPATYLHVLAFPLHLTLMTEPDFPFAPMGAVHVSNRIVVQQPVSCGETVDLTVTAEDLRPHPRGRLVTLVSHARVGDMLVWRDETVVLSRGDGDRGAVSAQPDVPDEAPTGPAQWSMPGNLGRQYAAVSGDRNPIHLYDVTARAFGFRKHIAHGMWTKARALAALNNRLPERYSVEVTFKKPVFLPSSVTFGARESADVIDFGVVSGSSATAHLLGRIRRI